MLISPSPGWRCLEAEVGRERGHWIETAKACGGGEIEERLQEGDDHKRKMGRRQQNKGLWDRSEVEVHA